MSSSESFTSLLEKSFTALGRELEEQLGILIAIAKHETRIDGLEAISTRLEKLLRKCYNSFERYRYFYRVATGSVEQSEEEEKPSDPLEAAFWNLQDRAKDENLADLIHGQVNELQRRLHMMCSEVLVFMQCQFVNLHLLYISQNVDKVIFTDKGGTEHTIGQEFDYFFGFAWEDYYIDWDFDRKTRALNACDHVKRLLDEYSCLFDDSYLERDEQSSQFEVCLLDEGNFDVTGCFDPIVRSALLDGDLGVCCVVGDKTRCSYEMFEKILDKAREESESPDGNGNNEEEEEEEEAREQ